MSWPRTSCSVWRPSNGSRTPTRTPHIRDFVIITTTELVKKANTNENCRCVLFFFPFLPWTDRGMDRRWRGKKRKRWTGSEGSVPAISAGVKSSAPYRKRHFHFTKQWAMFRAYLFHLSFKVGGWTDVKPWDEASPGGYVSLLCEWLFDFRWLTKGLLPFFICSAVISL